MGISLAVLDFKRKKNPERLSESSIGEVVSPRSIVPTIINISLTANRRPFLMPSNVPERKPHLNITSPGVRKKWNKIVSANNMRKGMNPFINLNGGSFVKRKGNRITIPRKP